MGDGMRSQATKTAITLGAMVLAVGMSCSSERSAGADQSSVQAKIARALSAGPDSVTKDATVAEPDGHGGMTILRQGSNDFTCMPGDDNAVGRPAMCAGKVAMQWNKDFADHRPKPTTTVP